MQKTFVRVARQTAIPFAATRRSRSPVGARLAALSGIAFAPYRNGLLHPLYANRDLLFPHKSSNLRLLCNASIVSVPKGWW